MDATPSSHQPASSSESFWNGHLRKLLDSTLDAFVTIGFDGRVLDWNERAETLFGWSRDEAIGQMITDLIILEEQREAQAAKFAALRKSREGSNSGWRIDMQAVRRDGEQIPVEFSLSGVGIDGQHVFHAFVRDISDWKSAEDHFARETLEAKLLQQAATLSIGESSFDEALQNCLAIVCDVTGWPIGHALVPNSASRKLVSSRLWYTREGDSFQELRDKTEDLSFAVGDGLPGTIWAARAPVWMKDVLDEPNFLRKSAVSDLGVRGAFGFPIHCDDEVVAVLEFFHREAIREDPNLLILTRSIGREFGHFLQRRRAIEQQSRLAAIVESSSDAIIAKSLDGTILSWNQGAERTYGHAAGEILGKSIQIIIPESRAHEDAEIRENVRLGKRLKQFETQRKRADGTLIDISLTVSPIHDSHGRIVGASTIERDITQLKQRERELQEAKDVAEAANQIKGEFLTNISHELRTPMNAIIGMVELALGEELSEAMTDYLQTARDSAHTLLHLLNDLLDFSRMEAGRFELAPAPFHLRDLLDRTMKMLSLRANEKGLELACHVHSDVPDHLKGDARRLQQVLINLVGNGVKFTQQGDVIVDVGLHVNVDGNPILRFTVIDTGIGISPDDLENIFTPFTQADASTTRKYTGTGLGLAISQALVDRMGGDLWVESEVGRGSRFSFTASFEVLDEVPPNKEQQQAVVQLRDMPVLVVDDNDANRRILKEMLQNWHMKPTVVDNGRDALAVLREAGGSASPGYPLILVDALMPHVDGFTFIETAREKGVLYGSTVLMLSSADRQLFQGRCDELGIAAYLEKPVSQSDLFDALMTALHGPDLDRETTAGLHPSNAEYDVLLVEDTPANQKVVRAILDKQGHNVTVAGNGRDAIDLLKQQSFDVVLMDVQMPTMDGFQATETIRQFDDEKAKIPIIAMTAHAMRGDRERCLKAGMDAYIAKPIDAADLIGMLDRFVVTNGRSSGQAGTEGGSKPASQPKPRTDREAVLTRLGGDEDLFRDMMRFFQEDAPALLQAVRSGLSKESWTDAERAAHSLKGLAANLGADDAVEAAKAMESAAAEESQQQARALLAQLESEVEALLHETEQLLQ